MPSSSLQRRAKVAIGDTKAGQELLDLLTLGFMTTGSIWYVDSNTGSDTTGDGRSTDSALATIDAAVGKCTANKGDVIVVMPGHAETVSAAGGITLDVAGVTVLGLGSGTDRPQITFATATSADIEIDAANVTISNIHFINDIDSLAAPLDVDAAYCTIEDCLFDDATASKQTVRWILADANADHLTVTRCVNHGSDTAGATAFITLTGCDHAVIQDCVSHGDFSAANIQVLTTAVTDALITRNHLENANAVDVNIEGVAASTGWISYNSCRIATDGQTTWVNTAGAMSLFENYGVNDDAETGKIVGSASV